MTETNPSPSPSALVVRYIAAKHHDRHMKAALLGAGFDVDQTVRWCNAPKTGEAALGAALREAASTGARTVVIDAHGYDGGRIGRTLRGTPLHTPADLISLAGGEPLNRCKLLIVGACEQAPFATAWAELAPNGIVVTASHETDDALDWKPIAALMRAHAQSPENSRTALQDVINESDRPGFRILEREPQS